MVDSWHFQDEPERLEDRARAARLQGEQLVVGDRVADDLAVAARHIVADEERVGDGPLADDAVPDERVRA